MKVFSRHLPYLKFLWMLMAVHILFIESEFPEALEDDPTPVVYTFTEKKTKKASLLSKIFVSKKNNLETSQIQEEIIEMPDYAPIGLKILAPTIPFLFFPTEEVVSHIGISQIQFDPESLSPPPRRA